MNRSLQGLLGLFVASITFPCLGGHDVAEFEGRVHASGGRPGAEQALLYTVSSNLVRVEVLGTNFPNAIDVVDAASGEITLISPMNRTFTRFKPGAQGPSDLPPGLPMPPGGLPPGIGPRAASFETPNGQMSGIPHPTGPIGPTNLPGMPAFPATPNAIPPGPGARPPALMTPGTPGMPGGPATPSGPAMNSLRGMPMPASAALEFRDSNVKSNILGYLCARYELSQRGETMEIWATDQIAPFQDYVPNQPSRFGPPRIERQWSQYLFSRKLFPLLAVSRADNGVERYRFQVLSITPAKLTPADLRGFEPPEGYVEIQPRPY